MATLHTVLHLHQILHHYYCTQFKIKDIINVVLAFNKSTKKQIRYIFYFKLFSIKPYSITVTKNLKIPYHSCDNEITFCDENMGSNK